MAAPKPVKLASVVTPPARPVTLQAVISASAVSSYRYLTGTASGTRLTYSDVAGFAWWAGPRADLPIRLSVDEALEGPFTQPSVSVEYFQNVGIEAGDMLAVHDGVNPDDRLATARMAQPQFGDGFASYRGETLFESLRNARPAFNVVRRGPMSAREALAILLAAYEVPNVYGVTEADIAAALPELMLWTTDGTRSLALQGLVIAAEDDAEDRESVLEILQRFFGMLPDYYYRADSHNLFTVVPPAWAANQVVYASHPMLGNYRIPWTAPSARLYGRVNPPHGTARFTFTVFSNLTPGDTESGTMTMLDGSTVTLTVSMTTTSILIDVTDTERIWTMDLTVRAPRGYTGAPLLSLPNRELAEYQADELDTNAIINSAVVTSSGADFQDEQQVIGPQDVTLDYDSTNPPRNPRTNTDISGAGNWQDNTARYSLWPSSGQEAAGGLLPMSNTVLMLEGQSLSIDISIDLAWTVWPASYNMLGQNSTWRTPEGYPRNAWLYAPGERAQEFTPPWTYTMDVPLDGTRQKLGLLTRGRHGFEVLLSGDIYIWWDTEEKGLRVTSPDWPQGAKEGGYNQLFLPRTTFIDPWIVSPRLTITGYATALADSKEVRTGAFSQLNGEADVVASVNTWGERIRELDLGPYLVDEETCQAVAETIVMRNVHPQRRRTVSILPPFVARPDDLGKGVEFASTGEQGVLIGRRYSEDESTPGTRLAECGIDVRMRDRVNIEDDTLDSYGDAVYGRAPYGGSA